MSKPPLVKVWTDASHLDGVAGLAGWIRDGGGDRVLFMDVVLATSSGIAERLALERAMTIARHAHWRRVVFYTDAKACWKGIPIKREKGWSVHWIPRTSNRQANVVSREVRKLWEAWNQGKGTITNPRPAAPKKQNRMVAPPAGMVHPESPGEFEYTTETAPLHPALQDAMRLIQAEVPTIPREIMDAFVADVTRRIWTGRIGFRSELSCEGKTCTCGIGPWTDRKDGPGAYCSTCGGTDLGLPVPAPSGLPLVGAGGVVRDRGKFIHVRVGGRS